MNFNSSPPIVRIRDNAGRGRFADFTAVVDTDGKITGFEKNAEGNFYNQDTVIVDIIPVGEDATGIPLLKEWNFNRFNKLENNLDTEYGYIFQNYNNALEYGYGHVGNPKALRVALMTILTTQELNLLQKHILLLLDLLMMAIQSMVHLVTRIL